MLTPITTLKPLHLQTILTDERSSAPIIVPDRTDFRELAAHLADVLSNRSGRRFPVIPQALDAEPGSPPGEGPAILVGNSMCLPALAHLYDQHYVYCDAHYPGPGGYVVRTVHNPFGEGRNVVVLGGSDVAGVAQAVERFLAEVGPGPELTLGHRILVQTDRLPLKATPGVQRDADATIRYHLTEGNRNRAFLPALAAGLLYHLTGHSGWAEIWRDAFFNPFQAAAGDTDRKPTGMAEFWIWSLVLTYDLIEEAPVFDDDQRLTITNTLLEYTDRASQMGYLQPEHLPPGEVRWNHQTFNALNCWFGGRYFQKYYGHPDADEWVAVAERCMEGMRGATRPHDEGGGYSSLTPDHTLIYALSRGDRAWACSEEIQAMAEWAFLIHDPTGRPVTFGDGGGWTRERGNVRYRRIWATLGALTGERRYVWMLRWAGDGPRRPTVRGVERQRTDGLFRVYDEWQRPPYAAEVSPTPPLDHVGVRAIAPLDRKVYDVEQTVPTESDAPIPPHERTVDKVAFREGLGPNAAYLLLDGFGGGRHGHSDSNAILRYTEHGRLWLADGGYNAETGAQYHNGLVVIRDSEAAPMPILCTLEAWSTMPGTALSITRLMGYGGATWTRTVIRRRGRYFLVLDHVRTDIAGEYDLRLLWRWLGEVERTEGRLRIEQRNVEAAQVLAGPDGRLKTELRYMVGRHPVWSDYPYAGPVVTIWEQRAVGPRHADSVCHWTNLLCAARGEEPEQFALHPVGTTTVQITEAEGRTAIAGSGSCTLDGVGADGLAFLLESEGIWTLASGKRMWAEDRSLTARHPITCEADWPRGRLVVEAGDQTELEITEDARRILLDGKRVDVVAGDGRVRLVVPIGRHVIRLSDWSIWTVPKLPPCPDTAVYLRPQPAILVQPRWELRLDEGITALGADGEGVLVGTQGGGIIALDSEGPERWRARVGDQVNDVVAADLDGDGEREVVVGDEARWVTAFSYDGRRRWRVRCPNGQLGTIGRARHLRVVDLDGDGIPEILVGTAGWWVLCIDAAGRERWRYECYAHATLDLVVEDLNADGRPEIVQANEYYYVHVIDAEGQGLASHYVGRKASRITTLAVGDLDGDGRVEIICGASDAQVRLLGWESQEDEPWPWRLVERWGRALGGEITALTLTMDVEGRPLILVGSEGYRLSALDSMGNVTWEVELGEPAQAIWTAEEEIAVVGETRWWTLGPNGERVEPHTVGGTITAVAHIGRSMVLGHVDGRVCGVDL